MVNILSPQAKKLRYARKKAKLSQGEAAGLLRVKRETFNGWETGRAEISDEKVAEFCTSAGVDMSAYRASKGYNLSGHPKGFNTRLLHSYLKAEEVAMIAPTEANIAVADARRIMYFSSLARYEGHDMPKRSIKRFSIHPPTRLSKSGNDIAEAYLASVTVEVRRSKGFITKEKKMTKKPAIASAETRKLKWAREHAGWSQQEAADKMGITRACYNGWETGRKPAPTVKYAKFCTLANANFENYKEPIEYDSEGYPYSFDMRLWDVYFESEMRVTDYWCEDPKNPKKCDFLRDDEEAVEAFREMEKPRLAYFRALAEIEGDEMPIRSLERAKKQNPFFSRLFKNLKDESAIAKDLEYLKRISASVKAGR